MKQTIICNGDSWVFGCEITNPEVDKKYGGPIDVYRGSYDYFEENDEYRVARIWPTYLKKYLDCETVNISYPADDNKTILYRTIDYITRFYLEPKKSTENLIVVIGWSSPERNSFWYKSKNIDWHFRIWPHVPHFDDPPQEEFWKLYVKHLWNPEEYIPRYIMDNITIKSFCEANNIKYLLFDSFYQIGYEPASNWDKPSIYKDIDKMKKHHYFTGYEESNRKINVHAWDKVWDQVKFPNFYHKDTPKSTFNDFIQQKLDNPYIGLHPSPEAHDVWAQEIAGYIKNHII